MAARHGPPTPGSEPPVIAYAKRPYQHDGQWFVDGLEDNEVAKSKAGKLPAPAAREQSEEFNDFIKASDIGKEGAKAVLEFTGNVRGPEDSEFGERVIAEVKYNRKTWDFSIKTNNANYRLCHEMFGADPSNWQGKVNVVIKHFRANDYIAIARQQKQ